MKTVAKTLSELLHIVAMCKLFHPDTNNILRGISQFLQRIAQSFHEIFILKSFLSTTITIIKFNTKNTIHKTQLSETLKELVVSSSFHIISTAVAQLHFLHLNMHAWILNFHSFYYFAILVLSPCAIFSTHKSLEKWFSSSTITLNNILMSHSCTYELALLLLYFD